MSFQLLLDATIIVLLLIFIGYAVVLSRQLRELRANRDEMAKIIASFNEATARAEAGIPRLRKTAEDAGRTLNDAVVKARTLRDDLAYMAERAEAMVPRLEDAMASNRTDAAQARLTAAQARAGSGHWLDEEDASKPVAEARPAAAPRPQPTRPGGGTGDPRVLPQNVPQNAVPQNSMPQSARPNAMPRPVNRPTEPVLSNRPGSPPPSPSPRPATGAGEDERSLAERELLRALRSVR